MKTFKSLVTWLAFIAVAMVSVSAAKPFWDRYWLQQEMRTAAVFGTKNSIEKTREFLTNSMREQGFGFTGEDFTVEKDEKSNVTITITYSDDIEVLGTILKPLKFTVKEYVENVPRML